MGYSRAFALAGSSVRAIFQGCFLAATSALTLPVGRESKVPTAHSCYRGRIGSG